MKKEFTPTQDLILEVLIARHRLGETLWTFDSNITKPLNLLASAGWVNIMSGITEGTVRASLTDKGVARWLSFNYKPRLKVEGLKRSIKDAKKLRDRFGGKNFWEK